MKIVITESQLNTIKREFDEVVTRNKEPYNWGATHNIYKTSDPNKLIKVGTENNVNEWYDIFKSRPDLFVKVYKRGITNFKFKNGEISNANYVMVEKLDTKTFKSMWHQFSLAVKNYENEISQYDHNSFQYYITRIEGNMDFIRGVAKSLEYNHILHNKFVEFINLLLDLYEIKSTADVHSDQFGIDIQGKIKCLDI